MSFLAPSLAGKSLKDGFPSVLDWFLPCIRRTDSGVRERPAVLFLGVADFLLVGGCRSDCCLAAFCPPGKLPGFTTCRRPAATLAAPGSGARFHGAPEKFFSCRP